MGFDKYFECVKLKFIVEVFFIGLSFSIFNYDIDFFEFICNGIVKIYEVDFLYLSEGKVYFDDVQQIVFDLDVFFCVIGWKYKFLVKFFLEGIECKIGVFYVLSVVDYGCLLDEGFVEQIDLFEKVDVEI